MNSLRVNDHNLLEFGDHVVIGSMRYDVRWTEELLVKALFRYHPALANAGIL